MGTYPSGVDSSSISWGLFDHVRLRNTSEFRSPCKGKEKWSGFKTGGDPGGGRKGRDVLTELDDLWSRGRESIRL